MGRAFDASNIHGNEDGYIEINITVQVLLSVSALSRPASQLSVVLAQ